MPIDDSGHRPERIAALALWGTLSSSSKRLVFAGAFLLIMTIGVVGLAIWNMRIIALQETRENVNSLGIAATEQTFRSIQGIDFVLQATQNDVVSSGITTAAQFATIFGRATANSALRRALSGLPQFKEFTVIGADGRQLSTSSDGAPPLGVSLQETYQYLRSHDAQTAFINAPMPNAENRNAALYLVRRVNSASGIFLGLLLAEINLPYFDSFYQELGNQNHFLVLLLDQRAAATPSLPMTEGAGAEVKPQDRTWYSVAGSGQISSLNARQLVPQGGRIIALNFLPEYPLAVAVYKSSHDALANWRKELLLTSFALAAATLWTLLLLRSMILQLRRLEHSQASLSRQNIALIQVEARIRYLADHDELTKLINRRVFRAMLEEALHLAGRNGGSLAVFYLDLDRFKIVNDTMGHGVGDKLLIQVTARLQQAVKNTGTIARTGGDEFALITSEFQDLQSISQFGRTLLGLFKAPFLIDGGECNVSSSMGIVRYPDHGADAGTLLTNASTALYRAKEDGPAQYRIFDAEMDARQQQLFVLEQALKQAVELGQFELEYQPIVEASSRRVVCFEALLRWRHPKHGIVSPTDFIELAENTGLIIPIGRWVLACACEEVAQWPDDIRIIVNLSPAQFNDEGLIDYIQEILHKTKLSASRLILEVTEGILLQKTKTVLDSMQSLRQLGIHFSLDDFGTGHSGLGYLRQFPFDNIKIDKLFIRDMVQQPQARAIVSALLAVGNALELTVVAEGVETESQLAELISLECRYVQGFGIGLPQPARDVRELMAVQSAGAKKFAVQTALHRQ